MLEQRLLRHIARFEYGEALAQESRSEGDTPVFGSNGQVGAHARPNTLAPCIIVGRKGSFGKVTWSDIPAFCIDTAYYVDKRHTRENLRWLYWVLQTLGLDAFSEDTGVPGLSREKAYQSYVPYTLLPEQTRIANFLDEQTARIDALIAEKERLDALLGEYRGSLISAAVTGQLDPTTGEAVRRAHEGGGGVSVWFESLPSGWVDAPLKSRLLRNDCGVWGEDPDGDEDTIVLRSTEQCVDGAWQIEEPATRKLSPSERGSALLEAGDLVVTKSSGSELHIGKTSLVTEEVAALGACYSNFMQRLRVDSRTEARFVHYWMNSPLCREQFSYLSSTTSGLANLNSETLGKVRMAFPGRMTQTHIANFLDERTSQIDDLRSHCREHIALLREYRSSLISAAVTGQLDIDNFGIGG